MIWFTEWLANKLGKLNPDTGEIIEYELPTPASEAYDVRVDGPGQGLGGRLSEQHLGPF
jgi:streptogramin lyase